MLEHLHIYLDQIYALNVTLQIKRLEKIGHLLRLRTNLVQDRTRVINRIHSLLDKYDDDMNFNYSKIFWNKGITMAKGSKSNWQ